MDVNLIKEEDLSDRRRGSNTSKSKDLELDIGKTRKSKVEMIKGAFGQKWCFKNNNKPTPSIKEIIDGLRDFYLAKCEEALADTEEST